ncbi:DUF5983 family protein [Novosphingobium sp. KACC 22771]|uniref:DUF5983 family protein n=1 Tax=Novosphingobium sp. KACC 22771 TaxID=3025670 RepID=UPI0023659436|nr:hypothetical protein [Novosphingobium sp. KACC 22771]WDF75244.1 hypothetical protein PQ467_19710 [Novosphingobium sp. KACC 22771]
MRETTLLTFSSLHLPVDERAVIEQAIRTSSRNVEGRLEVRYRDLVIEPHLDGFFVLRSAAGWATAEHPENVSSALWAILTYGSAAGAAWISFDREMSPDERWRIFL